MRVDSSEILWSLTGRPDIALNIGNSCKKYRQAYMGNRSEWKERQGTFENMCRLNHIESEPIEEAYKLCKMPNGEKLEELARAIEIGGTYGFDTCALEHYFAKLCKEQGIRPVLLLRKVHEAA